MVCPIDLNKFKMLLAWANPTTTWISKFHFYFLKWTHPILCTLKSWSKFILQTWCLPLLTSSNITNNIRTSNCTQWQKVGIHVILLLTERKTFLSSINGLIPVDLVECKTQVHIRKCWCRIQTYFPNIDMLVNKACEDTSFLKGLRNLVG